MPDKTKELPAVWQTYIERLDDAAVHVSAALSWLSALEAKKGVRVGIAQHQAGEAFRQLRLLKQSMIKLAHQQEISQKSNESAPAPEVVIRQLDEALELARDYVLSANENAYFKPEHIQSDLKAIETALNNAKRWRSA